jgi:type I restriction enzyme S subunit
MIPEGWTIKSLGDLADTYSGGTPSRRNPIYYDGEIPWIKSGEINQRFIKDVEERISDAALRKSSAKIVKPGTILVAMYGATAGVIGISEISAAINQAILAIARRKK